MGTRPYLSLKYDSRGRFASYWHQIDEIMSLNPNSVLEIGIGNGFLSKYLIEKGIPVTTLDIDRQLNPIVIGSVLKLPFMDGAFELLACFEVLEHMQFEYFGKALSEMARVSTNYIVISLPDSERMYRISIDVPKVGQIRKLFTVNRLIKPSHKIGGEHYWEIGEANYGLSKIIRAIRNSTLVIRKTYRVFEMPYHRFFVLEKPVRY